MASTARLTLGFALSLVLAGGLVASSLASRPLAKGLGSSAERRQLQGGSKVLVGYIGARGDPEPNFTDTPLGGNPTYLALSFASEGGDGNFGFNGIFNPSNSPNLTPDNAAAAAQAGYNFLLALYGDSYTYSTPSDTASFVSNAVSSIQGLASQWSATGIELNVENGLDSSFPGLWCEIAQQLKANNPSFIVAASPFSATFSTYLDLYNQCPSAIDWFDYQLYAEISGGDVNGAVTVMNNLASQMPASALTIGFDSNTAEPRGPQLSDFVSALGQLSGGGFRGVNVFSIEDSQRSYQFSDVQAIQGAM